MKINEFHKYIQMEINSVSLHSIGRAGFLPPKKIILTSVENCFFC